MKKCKLYDYKIHIICLNYDKLGLARCAWQDD